MVFAWRRLERLTCKLCSGHQQLVLLRSLWSEIRDGLTLMDLTKSSTLTFSAVLGQNPNNWKDTSDINVAWWYHSYGCMFHRCGNLFGVCLQRWRWAETELSRAEEIRWPVWSLDRGARGVGRVFIVKFGPFFGRWRHCGHIEMLLSEHLDFWVAFRFRWGDVWWWWVFLVRMCTSWGCTNVWLVLRWLHVNSRREHHPMLSTYYEPASFLPQVNDGKYSSWQQTIARCKHHSDGGRFIDSHFDRLIFGNMVFTSKIAVHCSVCSVLHVPSMWT